MEKVRKGETFTAPFPEISENEGSGSKDEWSIDAEEDLTVYEELIASLQRIKYRICVW